MTTATPAVQHCYTTGSANNRLHYLDYGGAGRPLVLMHGVTGNAWNWYQVAAGLTDRRIFYALFFRGYG
jgi:pimeloyl-ACP methyl ester carboxylesterase